jgi:hypothetical protein
MNSGRPGPKNGTCVAISHSSAMSTTTVVAESSASHRLRPDVTTTGGAAKTVG